MVGHFGLGERAAFAVEDQPPGRGNGEAHRASIAIGEDGGSGGGLLGLFIFGFGVLGNCQSAEEGQDASDDHPLHATENSAFSVIYQSHSLGFPRIASTISLGRKIDSVMLNLPSPITGLRSLVAPAPLISIVGVGRDPWFLVKNWTQLGKLRRGKAKKRARRRGYTVDYL